VGAAALSRAKDKEAMSNSEASGREKLIAGGDPPAPHGSPDEAAEHQCALEVTEHIFGPASIEVAAILNKLGGVHGRAGRVAEAHQAYVRALEITEERLGPDHLQLAGLYRSLAELELARDRFVTGEPYARRALEIRERAMGHNQVEVAGDMAVLAVLLAGQGRSSESELLYRGALAVFEATAKLMHEKAAACRAKLANPQGISPDA
jgi:tetratricopeptide (TPR) repeat protein